ncbi:MAG: class I SAM-dependent methyltransferase [Coriobacteriales bacterium]|nr:class I SAM-dependent methyltransferase [Coriobacteriales bacterium]
MPGVLGESTVSSVPGEPAVLCSPDESAVPGSSVVDTSAHPPVDILLDATDAGGPSMPLGFLPHKQEYVKGVFATIATHYDVMNDLESLGLHRRWKARLVRRLSARGPQRILDVACGTGDVAIALARANPKAQVLGLDFSPQMLDIAKRRAATELPLTWRINAKGEALPQSNLSFVLGSALELPYADSSFDAVAIAFGLRNMPDYARVLVEIYRVLRPEGAFYCLETSNPEAPFVLVPFRLYMRYWLPLLGKLVAGSPTEYVWLDTSTRAFLTKRRLITLIQNTGFVQPGYQSFMLGASALHWGIKPA